MTEYRISHSGKSTTYKTDDAYQAAAKKIRERMMADDCDPAKEFAGLTVEYRVAVGAGWSAWAEKGW